MLEATTRKTVDALWDLLWSSGVTNPLAVLDYLVALLLVTEGARARRSLPALRRAIRDGDGARCAELLTAAMRAAGLSTPDATPWADTVTLERALALALALAPRAGRSARMRDRDLLGDCFEYLLSKLGSAGYFGQFRTPRRVIEFLVAALDPREGERVLDPACGTGGFLIAAHAHRRGAPGAYLGDECDWSMARVAAANVHFHALPDAHIRRRDAFAHTNAEADVILANPPFSGTVVAGRRAGFVSGSAQSEVLFVELMMQRLERGGRAGTVVPVSMLTSEVRSAVAVREALVERQRLRAVIELPPGVFLPYTEAPTGVLVWENARPSPSAGVLFARASDEGPGSLDALLPLVRGETPVDRFDRSVAREVSRATVKARGYALGPARYVGRRERRAARERGVTEVVADVSRTMDRLRGLLEQIAEGAR